MGRAKAGLAAGQRHEIVNKMETSKSGWTTEVIGSRLPGKQGAGVSTIADAATRSEAFLHADRWGRGQSVNVDNEVSVTLAVTKGGAHNRQR